MSSIVYVPFETLERIGRMWSERGQTVIQSVMIWTYVIGAAFFLLFGFYAVLYCKLKGYSIDARRIVVSQIAVALIMTANINLMVYKRLWLFVAMIPVVILLMLVALKLTTRQQEENGPTPTNRPHPPAIG